MALREAPKVLGRLSAARRDLKKRSGRQAEKLAILTSGAYLLDRLVDPSLSDGMAGDAEILVSKWAETEAAVNGSAGEWDNRVTTTILPWALREASWPEGPVGHPAAWIERQDTLEGAIVWVSSAALADAWADHQRGRIEQRTDTQSAIAQQIKRCQDEHALNSKVWDVSPGRRERKQARYLALRAEVADVVIKRSQGW